MAAAHDPPPGHPRAPRTGPRGLAGAGGTIDGGVDVLVRRLKRAEARRAPVCDPHMFAVLLVLQDAAAAGQRCPSDAALAEATDLSPDQVKWQLKKLRQAGFVKVATLPTPGDARFRVVTVVATGATTAGPPA
jgi:hypothetical protein